MPAPSPDKVEGKFVDRGLSFITIRKPDGQPIRIDKRPLSEQEPRKGRNDGKAKPVA